VQHEMAKRLDPFTPFQSALLSWACRYRGDTETAKEQAGRTLELSPDGAMGLLVLGVTYVQAGRTEDARAIARAMEAEPGNSFSALGLAILCGQLGDVQNTYRWLTYEPPHAWIVAVTIDPIVGVPSEVLSDPVFEEFLARINLPTRAG